MQKSNALAKRPDPLIYEFPVKYQRDRTGWMAWPEGLPVTAIAQTKTGVRRKLRDALRAYFRSTLRYGDPLPVPPRRIPAEAETIMICAWPS